VPIVAFPLLLAHMPLKVISFKVIEEPTQTAGNPVIGAGSGFIVIF
jgi:hypothetical protein